MTELFKSGTFNLPAGIYLEVDVNGNSINDAKVVVLQYGYVLPPAQSKCNKWINIVVN